MGCLFTEPLNNKIGIVILLGGKNMKKVLILSTLVAILIVLGGLSPSICSKDIEPVQISQNSEMIPVEVNRYYGQQSETIQSELSYEEAEELTEILTLLNEAIKNNDEGAIDQFEKILNEKGIFGDNYQKFFSQNTYIEMMKTFRLNHLAKYLGILNDDNISNSLCFFNAVGNGTIVFALGVRMYEAIVRIVENQTSVIAALILFIALLPLLLTVVIFTSLIPFRILMSEGIVVMYKGKISSIGLQGRKRLDVEGDDVAVNISWFTGITLNLLFTENRFTFVSGIALKVEESDY